MRNWPGVRADMTQVGGDHLIAATGVSWYVEGELRRRPGFSAFAAVGGSAIGHYYSKVTGSWLLVAESDGDVQAVDLDDGSATDIGDVKVDQNPHIEPLNPRVYVADDFNTLQVWDGVWSALRTAGIAAPDVVMPSPSSTAAGDTTAGVHLIRYRYLDSQSPEGRYQSDPSDALSYTVTSSNEELTFTINDTGTSAIKRSTDPKVDTIQIEMTTKDGSTYFVATTVANSASSVVVDIADAVLELEDLADVDGDGDFGHEQPPLTAYVFESRDRAWALGFHTRTFTGCGVTNGSPTITGSGFSTNWAGRLVRVGTDSRSYVISSITATTITLTENYDGSTDANASIDIYPKNPNRLYWSRRYYPESWKQASWAIDTLVGSGDRVVGGTDYLGDPWIFGTRTLQRLVFDDDPGESDPVTVAGQSGVWNINCVVKPDEDTMLGWGSNGVWAVIGGRPLPVSEAIDKTWRALIDYDQSGECHAVYYPDEKMAFFFFVRSGDTKPKDAVVLDMKQRRLGMAQFRQAITASDILADNNGRLRALLSDENGYTWFMGGDTDGVPSSSSGGYTGAGGGSTTSTPVNESLPTGSDDLAGCMMYLPDSDEAVLISSNTADTITHAAIAAAVTAGQDVYVGSIPCEVEFSWYVGRGMRFKKRPSYLELNLHPDSDGELRVYIYRDFASSPHSWTLTDGQTTNKAVTWTNGATYATVDLDTADSGTGDGYVNVPLPSDWSRALRVKIEVVNPAGTVRVLDVRWLDDDGNEVDGAGE